ncbi:MAG: hypothetical protein ACLR4A_14770 [Christensenellales bacterium]
MTSPFDSKNRVAAALDRLALRVLLFVLSVGYFFFSGTAARSACWPEARCLFWPCSPCFCWNAERWRGAIMPSACASAARSHWKS